MIGFIAACLTTFGFVPQVIKVIKTKDTESISLGMYLMAVTGMILWAIHGFHHNDMAIVLANAISATLAGIVLIYKLIYQ
ncbi:SemiSWEET transporter [Streptococcus pluranimalium]